VSSITTYSIPVVADSSGISSIAFIVPMSAISSIEETDQGYTFGFGYLCHSAAHACIQVVRDSTSASLILWIIRHAMTGKEAFQRRWIIDDETVVGDISIGNRGQSCEGIRKRGQLIVICIESF
jgi:hypothetical protein